jgi:hypothetical protein
MMGEADSGTVFFRDFTLRAQWGRLKANNACCALRMGPRCRYQLSRRSKGLSLRGTAEWCAGSLIIVREK